MKSEELFEERLISKLKNASQIKSIETERDSDHGIIEITLTSGDQVAMLWGVFSTEVSLLWGDYTIEDIDIAECESVLESIATKRYEIETKGWLLKWSRAIFQLSNGEDYKTDWFEIGRSDR